MSPAVLRGAAIVLALVAFADPAVTSERAARPVVSLVEASPSPAGPAIERALRRRFTVVRGALSNAAGTVVSGATVPDDIPIAPGPAFAVIPDAPVRVVQLRAPTVVSTSERATVLAILSATRLRGRSLVARLSADGFVADSVRVPVTADSATVEIRLGWVPPAPGVSRWRVEVSAPGLRGPLVTEGLASVRDEPARVLVFDARPSWLSTFVRRGLEDDPRFTVAHRVLAARGVAGTAGLPPASLQVADLVSRYAVVVVGAPEALTAADAAGLGAFVRSGGSAVLLMDRRAAGPIDRLTSVHDWRGRRLAAPVAAEPHDLAGALRGREHAWPAALPPGATSLATITLPDSARAPVVWQAPLGAGRLIVSGAMDAWQFRDRSSSGFASFWASLVRTAAAMAVPPLEVRVDRGVLRPGEATMVRVSTRPPPPGVEVAVSARVASGADTMVVRLWPDALPGTFSGRFVAPRRPGTWYVLAANGAVSAVAPVVVDSQAAGVARDDREAIEVLVRSRRGAVIAVDSLDVLADRLSSALRPVLRVETWHPMRSPWWILPFALALGAEWWWRRRRGLA